MRVAEMNGIKLSDAHVNEILRGQALRSLVDENPSPVPPFYVLPERARLIHIDFIQEAGTVSQASDTRSMQDITCNRAPPQVDVYTYRYIRIGETRTIGEWEWRSFAPAVPYRLLHLSAAKKTVQLLSQDLVASYVEGEDTLIIEISFQRLFVEGVPYLQRRFFLQQCLFLNSASYERDRSCSRSGSGIRDAKTCFLLDIMYESGDALRIGRHVVSKTLVGPISEEDQKENERQPKPGKRKPEEPKPEKPKPERKGDKGSRRVKRPNVQGLVFSLRQKRGELVAC